MPHHARTLVFESIRGQWRHIVPASLAAAVHQGCEATVPVMIGVVVQQAIERQSLEALGWTLGGLALLFAALTASMRLGGQLVRKTTQGAGHDLRVRMARRILDPRGIGTTWQPGALLSTATSDTQRVGMVNAGVWMAAGAASAIVTAAVLLLQASVVLGLVVLIGLVPVTLLTALISKPLVKRSSAEQAAAAAAAGTATDLVSGLRVLAGLGAQAAASARYAAASGRSRAAAVRAAAMMALRTGCITALTGGFLAVVAFVGARLAAQNTIGISEFIAAVGLTQFLLGPFSRIAAAGTWFARARASAARIAGVLHAPFAVADGNDEPAETNTVALELRAVDYGPLQQLDLTVRSGEFVGVVAPDPAAATALLTLLSREDDPTGGELRCNGLSCTAMDPAFFRWLVLVSTAETPLFSTTVDDNIRAGAERYDDAVLRAADIEQLAEELPDGLDTELTERGLSLSGGQRQRVALARALATDVPALVLHDPTTAVDAVTETRIAAGLREVRTGRTTVVVTTSPALLAVADRVVLLDEGTVTASDQHTALARNHADYAAAVFA